MGLVKNIKHLFQQKLPSIEELKRQLLNKQNELTSLSGMFLQLKSIQRQTEDRENINGLQNIEQAINNL